MTIRTILLLAGLLVFSNTVRGQNFDLINAAGKPDVSNAAFEQTPPLSEVLGNPFGDDATANPEPIAQELAPSHRQPAPLPNTFMADSPPASAEACSTATTNCNVVPSCAPATNCCSSECGGCGSCGGGMLTCLSDCDLGEAFAISGALHGDCPPAINIGGWLQAGYHTADNSLFNNRPDKFALHQGWLYAEKAADACTSPLGFRVDLMYGLDAAATQAFGNPPGSWDYINGFDHGAYGWAIPQAYLELALGDWKIKAGHFYTLIGYEVVTAPDNFFYSHAMTMFNSEPFTHTGVLATREIGDVTVYGGWTAGWDTGFEELNGGSSWLGGFSQQLGEDASLTYISTAGNFGWRGDEAYSHSIVLDMAMTDDLNWVVQSDLLRVKSTGEDNVGINQYFLYSVSDCLGFGARVEWWKGDVLTGYAPHGGVAPAFGSYSNYAATFGANIRPHANIVVRPEVRIDWSPAANYDESYFGVDAVLTF